MNKVVIIGGCAGAKVAYDIFESMGWEVIGVSNNYTKDWSGIEIDKLDEIYSSLGASGIPYDQSVCWFVAAGDNAQRERMASDGLIVFHGRCANAFHPSAVVSRYARIGMGILICANAVLGVGATLCDGVILNTAATVDHDCFVGDFAQIGPGAHVCGYVHIGSRAFIGAGATVLPHAKIGDDAIVGAGAVVVEDVDPGETVIGVPARLMGVTACKP